MTLLFFDLSLLHSPTSPNSRLLAAARALELGYAAVALDHPHRGIVADSDRCRLAPFPLLSSLPLPSSASFHRTRNGSPTSEPFRQYTRITLSLDSAAAAASALAPSAARLLRTYDIVAARPITQAALDHLCQAVTDLDLISIDFSHKLPFRLKLPMLKLALQRGLHFEIAYSPLIDDVNSRRQVLAEAKLLVDWTKGKNLIISSAAHNANEIRGPYDVINLCEYLLGLSTQRAKAAMSVNCRSLISKALRKKHFYKETIRIGRLLPNEQLNSTSYKLGDWIGWDPVSFDGDLQFLKTNLESSSKNDELPGSPINSSTKVLGEKPCDADVSLFDEKLEQSTDDKEDPDETQEETMQVNRGEVRINCSMSTLLASSGDQVVGSYTTLDKPENSEIVTTDNVQAGAASFVDQKCICEHVEFLQDAMQIDATESSTLNLVAGETAPLSSDVKLACSSLPQSMDLFDTSLEDKCPDQTTAIPDNAKAYAKHETGCISYEREDQAPLDHEISSGSDACLEDKGLDKPHDTPVDLELHINTEESLGCNPGFRDNEAPLYLAVKLSSDLCKDILPREEVTEGRTEQNMEENIEQRGKVEPIDRKASIMISEAHTNSIAFAYDKGSSDTTRETHELKEPNSKEINASLEKNIAKIHKPLSYSYASGKVGISTSRSEKRRQNLWLHRPTYLPFLGFLKPVPFKKKVHKVRGHIKSFISVD